MLLLRRERCPKSLCMRGGIIMGYIEYRMHWCMLLCARGNTSISHLLWWN